MSEGPGNPEIPLVIPDAWSTHSDNMDRIEQASGRIATPADLIAAVRAGVESGTITGGIVDTESRAGFWLADHLNQFPPKTYLVIEVEQR